MNEADVKRKLQQARRTDTIKAWRDLAKEFRKHGYEVYAQQCDESAKECEDNKIEAELRKLETKPRG